MGKMDPNESKMSPKKQMIKMKMIKIKKFRSKRMMSPIQMMSVRANMTQMTTMIVQQDQEQC